MSMLELDGFEARGDPGGSVGVTGEEDVLGQFAWTEVRCGTAVLRLGPRCGDHGCFDAVVRVRQDLFLARVAASLARNSAEDSPAFSRASSRVDRAWPTLSRAWRRGPVGGGPGRALRTARERGQPAGDPGRQAALRLLATEEGDRQRGRRDGEERAEPGGARIERQRPAETGDPAEGAGGAPGDALADGSVAASRRRASTAADGVAATGSPARTMPPGSSTTTTVPSAVASTRPIALSASSGSMRASRRAAGPRRTTRPMAVPSSRLKPSGRRSTTRPPTRTSAPDDGREVDEVGVGRGLGWTGRRLAPVAGRRRRHRGRRAVVVLVGLGRLAARRRGRRPGTAA